METFIEIWKAKYVVIKIVT